MISKYGPGVLTDMASLTNNGAASHILRDISTIGANIIDLGRISNNNFFWQLGDGRTIRFWEDYWCGETPLCVEFARLYSMSTLKFHSVKSISQVWSFSLEERSSIWKRPLRAWEEMEFSRLNMIIEQVVFANKSGNLIWHHNNKKFSTKDCYLALVHPTLQDTVWKLIWKIRAPPKVLIFLWKMAHNILPTKCFLMRRINTGHISPTCSWCGLHDESLDHLFVKCEIAC